MVERKNFDCEIKEGREKRHRRNLKNKFSPLTKRADRDDSVINRSVYISIHERKWEIGQWIKIDHLLLFAREMRKRSHPKEKQLETYTHTHIYSGTLVGRP